MQKGTTYKDRILDTCLTAKHTERWRQSKKFSQNTRRLKCISHLLVCQGSISMDINSKPCWSDVDHNYMQDFPTGQDRTKSTIHNLDIQTSLTTVTTLFRSIFGWKGNDTFIANIENSTNMSCLLTCVWVIVKCVLIKLKKTEVTI